MPKLFSSLVVAGTVAANVAFADSPVQRLNSGVVLPENLPFSEIVVAGDTVYVSGMIGIKPRTLDLVEGGIEAETRQTLENIKTMLEANGYGVNNLVKCTVFLENISEYGAFNNAYARFFGANQLPARTTLGGTDLAFGAKVEVDCIGAK